MAGTCSSCWWWQRGYRDPAGKKVGVEWKVVYTNGEAIPTGPCRLNPPQVPGHEDGEVWPYTHEGDWCGKYRHKQDHQLSSEHT